MFWKRSQLAQACVDICDFIMYTYIYSGSATFDPVTFDPVTFDPVTFDPVTLHPDHISPKPRFTQTTFHPNHISPKIVISNYIQKE